MAGSTHRWPGTRGTRPRHGSRPRGAARPTGDRLWLQFSARGAGRSPTGGVSTAGRAGATRRCPRDRPAVASEMWSSGHLPRRTRLFLPLTPITPIGRQWPGIACSPSISHPVGIALPQRFYVVGAVAACLVIASHLIALGSPRPGLLRAEAGFGYNACTIWNYGPDQFAPHWPLSFLSSGDSKGPPGFYFEPLLPRFLPLT